MNTIVFYTDAELYGGAEKQMLTLISNLSNWKCIVIVRDVPVFENLFRQLEQLPHVKIIKMKAKSKHSLSLFFQTFFALKKIKPCLIHLHSWNPMSGKYLILAAKILKIKVVNTQHDPFPLKFPKSIYQKWSLKNSKIVIAVSEKNRETLNEILPKSKILTVHNGIELTENMLISQSEKERYFTKFDLRNEHKVILSVGTLHPRKGFLDLLAAYNLIQQKYPEWRLIIAGEGPQKEILEQQIGHLKLKEKVKLIGFRDDLENLFQIADVFALASHQEAFGLVVVEAMNAGKAILATNSGGVPEIVQNEVNGILVEPKNSVQLAQALSRLIENPELRQKLGQNAKIRSQVFSAKQMALSYEKIYQLTLQK